MVCLDSRAAIKGSAHVNFGAKILPYSGVLVEAQLMLIVEAEILKKKMRCFPWFRLRAQMCLWVPPQKKKSHTWLEADKRKMDGVTKLPHLGATFMARSEICAGAAFRAEKKHSYFCSRNF